MIFFQILHCWPECSKNCMTKIKTQVSESQIFIHWYIIHIHNHISCFFPHNYTIIKQRSVWSAYCAVGHWESDPIGTLVHFCLSTWVHNCLGNLQFSANCYNSTFQEFFQFFSYLGILQVPGKKSNWMYRLDLSEYYYGNTYPPQ